jgi:hypothetical protein
MDVAQIRAPAAFRKTKRGHAMSVMLPGNERGRVAYSIHEPESEQHWYLIAIQQLLRMRQPALHHRRLGFPARTVHAAQPERGLVAAERTDERHHHHERQIQQLAVREETAEQRDRLPLDESTEKYRDVAILLDPRGDFVHRRLIV